MSRRDFPVHACFVDFSKAFDSVKWNAIAQQLLYWHAPEEILTNVFNVMAGHRIQVRVDNELSPAFPVQTGVLQGDTLAPYLFVIVLDAVLRQLRPSDGLLLSKPAPKLTKRQQAAFTHPPETRLTALAFADDVCLLSHSVSGLQNLFTTFERAALQCGLRVNMGKGKTERVSIGAPPGSIYNNSGEIIPTVANYKYLGVELFDWDTDFGKRKSKAWSSLVSFNAIWKSRVSFDAKRNLFQALVEPIFTYGISAWPLTEEQKSQLNGAYGRMLRYALGLPPAYISRKEFPSESIYKDLPMMSTQAEYRRYTLIAHTLREHCEGRRQHPLIDILLFDTYDMKRKSTRHTILDRLLRSCRIEFPEQLLDLMKNREKSKLVAREIFESEQTAQIDKRILRRSRESLADQSNDNTSTPSVTEPTGRRPVTRGHKPRQTQASGR